jgi:hypothetical protein
MKKDLLPIILTFVLTLALAGCGTPATPPPATPAPTETESAPPVPPTVTATLDPCGSGQIQDAVQKVHKHMREFDDASTLASSTPREQLSNSIANLQRIRREAEDEKVPPCLTNLQKYQVDHMNTVIGTLIAFIGGADKKALEPGIALAQQQHDQYTLEFARLLGLTVVPATTPTP